MLIVQNSVTTLALYSEATVYKLIKTFHKSLWGHLYFEVVSFQTGVV